MAKLGLLMPEAGMVKEAEAILAASAEHEAVVLKAISTADAVNEARDAVAAGAQVVIARGYQASLIRQYTKIPLVEIRFTGQEIGLLLMRAREISGLDRPHVVMIAFPNMLPDMTHMEELFHVKLTVKLVERIEEAGNILASMRDERIDVVIGGRLACEAAETQGYLTLFYHSTGESIAEALQTAAYMASAMELEKQGNAQFETVLDTSFNGIIRVNADAQIIVVNKIVENLVGRATEEAAGRPLAEVLPQIDGRQVEQILSGEKESVSTSVNIRDEAWMLLMAPVEYDGRIRGAILSLRRITDLTRFNKKAEQEMIRYGYFSNVTFEDIKTDSAPMRRVLEDAKMFALSDSPVLLRAPAGTEGSLIAKAIHNNSRRKSGPFVSVSVFGLEPKEQVEALFQRGDEGSQLMRRGAMLKADHGTIFINDIEQLGPAAQQLLLRTLISWSEMRTDAMPVDTLDVRIIAGTTQNLKSRVQRGEFSAGLYYRLNGLLLQIPGINRRPEDLDAAFRSYFRKYTKRYNRPLKITDGGYKKIGQLRWDGNFLQLETFSERLVLSAEKRMVDEVYIGRLYDLLYPDVIVSEDGERVVVYDSPEGRRIRQLLEKHRGNRAKVAEELGVSMTTLWRHMKKYGVEAKFQE